MVPSKEAKIIFLVLSTQQEKGHDRWKIGHSYKGMSFKKWRQATDELIDHKVIQMVQPMIFRLNPNWPSECDADYLVQLFED